MCCAHPRSPFIPQTFSVTQGHAICRRFSDGSLVVGCISVGGFGGGVQGTSIG